MKYSIALLLVLLAASLCKGQPKEFVCTPCGLECDSKVVNHAGSCSACGMALVEKVTVNTKNLTVDDVCKRIAVNPNIILLDVRSPQEFSGTSDIRSYGHFKNAININVTDLQSRAGELSKYKDQEIIVYCSHSHRSPRATYLLSTLGFKNVSNMEGGVSTLAGQQGNECLKKNFVFH